jgi:hypothetical protein
LIHNDGLRLLCAAVIDKARQDYITGPECNLRRIEAFVRSDLFQLYSLGVNPDPDTVLREWNDERRDYRAELIRNGKRVVNT